MEMDETEGGPWFLKLWGSGIFLNDFKYSE